PIDGSPGSSPVENVTKPLVGGLGPRTVAVIVIGANCGYSPVGDWPADPKTATSTVVSPNESSNGSLTMQSLKLQTVAVMRRTASGSGVVVWNVGSRPV